MNETRQHILTTSLALFLKKSYRDVTMREIVQKSGLSKGAFYHYFTSKEELFREIAGMFFTLGTVDYSTFDTASLKVFYNQYIKYISESLYKINLLFRDSGNQKFEFNFFLILFEAVSRFPEFLQIELELHKKDVNAWKKAISHAKKNREIQTRSTDKQIAELFLYCNDGVFLRFINNNKDAAFSDFLTGAYDTIYENLKNPLQQ